MFVARIINWNFSIWFNEVQPWSKIDASFNFFIPLTPIPSHPNISLSYNQSHLVTPLFCSIRLLNSSRATPYYPLFPKHSPYTPHFSRYGQIFLHDIPKWANSPEVWGCLYDTPVPPKKVTFESSFTELQWRHIFRFGTFWYSFWTSQPLIPTVPIWFPSVGWPSLQWILESGVNSLQATRSFSTKTGVTYIYRVT